METPAILPMRSGGSQWAAPPPPAGHSVHVVQHGDTLDTIAHQYGAPLDAIRQVNPQIRDGGRVAVGDTINLPNHSETLTRAQPYESPAPSHSGGSQSSQPEAMPANTGARIDVPRVDVMIRNLLPQSSGALLPHESMPPGSTSFTRDPLPPSVNPLPHDPLPPSANPQPHDTLLPSGSLLPHDAVPPSVNPLPLPHDTLPPPGSNPLPHDTSPPNGNLPPRGGDQIGNSAAAPRAETIATSPPQAAVTSDPRGLTTRTDVVDVRIATDKAMPAATNASNVPANGATIVAPGAQLVATMLTAPLVASPQTAAAPRGEAAVPPRPFDGVPVMVTVAKDIPQNVPTERREMPRLAESDARLMSQMQNEPEKLGYDSTKLLRDVQARILSDARPLIDVPGRTPAFADPATKATDKSNANATIPADAGVEESQKRLAMSGGESDSRVAIRKAGDFSWMFDWVGQLAQIRRAYSRKRPDDSVDLLTTAAIIGTGVALLAGLFALYALYKYWAPH